MAEAQGSQNVKSVHPGTTLVHLAKQMFPQVLPGPQEGSWWAAWRWLEEVGDPFPWDVNADVSDDRTEEEIRLCPLDCSSRMTATI